MNAILTTIQGERIADYLTGRRKLCLPAGAQITAFWRDVHWIETQETRPRLFLRIEHPSFPPVPPGSRIPCQRCPRTRIQTISTEPEQTITPKAISQAKVPYRKITRRRIVIEEITSE